MTLDPSDERHAHAAERLEHELIGWLTTVTPDGRPQTMPIWFLWDDGEILFYSQAKSVRNRNLRANTNVSFHLNDDGRGDDVLSIEGEARFDPDAIPGKDNAAYLAKYQGLLDEYEWTGEYFTEHYPHPVRIRPTKFHIA
jgi:PPOX class probable F420-dependent enzyme